MRNKAAEEEKIKYLIEELNGINWFTRYSAVTDLGEIGSKKAVFPLLNSLFDESNKVKLRAIYSLGKIGSLKAVAHLVKFLKDGGGLEKHESTLALGKIRAKFVKNRRVYSPRQPIHIAFKHIDPKTHPNSFLKLFEEAQKKPRKSPEYWKLTAKQLMAMERKLK